MGIGSPVFCTFHSPQPNNIGPARQQPRDWALLLISLSQGRGGAQLLLISFASTRVHGICNGSINRMKDKCPPHQPQISEFLVWDWEGAQKCFIHHDQTTGDLKSHHLQARVTLTALSVPPRPHFLSAKLLCG